MNDLKKQVIEAVSELIYDLEKEGKLIDADAIRSALQEVKDMTNEQIQSMIDKVISEQEVSN